MNTLLQIFVPAYMIAFLFVAMFLPSYRLYKRTGVNPVTFGKNSDTAHDYIGVLFKIFFIVIALYGLSSSFIPLTTILYLDRTVLKIIGIVLSLLSLLFIVVAQKTMSDSWRIGIDEKNKTKLVTKGPFQYVRNPIFSGMLAVLVSLFLMIPTYFMGYLAVLSYLIINIQVRLEEEFLSKVHGKDYIDYKASVGRFLPRIFRY